MRAPKLKLPPKSTDCHCHVFGPRDKYPWAANRLYTPPPVTLDDYLAMLKATGFERGVMVQTGLYGPDNRFIVDAIQAHPKQLRGIAPAQVPNCEVAVYGGYTGHMASTLVLAKDA